MQLAFYKGLVIFLRHGDGEAACHVDADLDLQNFGLPIWHCCYERYVARAGRRSPSKRPDAGSVCEGFPAQPKEIVRPGRTDESGCHDNDRKKK